MLSNTKLVRTIAVWSGPRNVSTALMYSFRQRQDTEVLDEPLFGHFLKHTGVWRPSRDEVLQTMETDAEILFNNFHKSVNKPNLFLKNMANHIEGLSYEILMNYKNIILIRHPAKVLSSYTRQMESPTELDLGYRHQLQILDFLTEKGLPIYVLDSDVVLENPERALQALCKYLEMDFDPAMLRWPAGAKPEDGIWAKYWYTNVHASTGFQKAGETKKYQVPPDLNKLLTSSIELYHKIKQYE